jgi:hypothetical protein
MTRFNMCTCTLQIHVHKIYYLCTVYCSSAHGDAAIGTDLVCNLRSWIQKLNISGATGFGLCGRDRVGVRGP